jgi:hypothetical protein
MFSMIFGSGDCPIMVLVVGVLKISQRVTRPAFGRTVAATELTATLHRVSTANRFHLSGKSGGPLLHSSPQSNQNKTDQIN